MWTNNISLTTYFGESFDIMGHAFMEDQGILECIVMTLSRQRGDVLTHYMESYPHTWGILGTFYTFKSCCFIDMAFDEDSILV